MSSTNNHTAAPSLDALVQPLIDFWTESIASSAEHAKILLESAQGAHDLDTIRRRWLEALAQSMDRYMRSPVFLQSFRNNLDAMTLYKSTQENVVQEIAREAGIPRLNDISGLFDRIQVGQEAILERLRAIETRLAALETTKHSRKSNG